MSDNTSLKPAAKKNKQRLPKWLKHKLPIGKQLYQTDVSLKKESLATVCEEAFCPNRTECWSKKTATFLVLGKVCSRNCGFCEIKYSPNPPPPDPNEATKILSSLEELQLKHVVITMVSRDDLNDGGASHLAKIIQTIHNERPEITIEVLTSDFGGNEEALKIVLDTGIKIFNHNIETIERLSPFVRHKATYTRSLSILAKAASLRPDLFIKSGLMVGLGENEHEVKKTLIDLSNVGTKIVTIGQYLQPSRRKIPVKAYISPTTFDYYKSLGAPLNLFIYAGPFIRSSYNAAKILGSLHKTSSL